MEHTDLYSKISKLPEGLKSEVLIFVENLLKSMNANDENNSPKFGSAKGKIYTSPDFDEPLEDFKDYM